MTQRMNRLPPDVRSHIARQIGARGPQGVVTVATIMESVRTSCPNTITDRELEDAIAEQAISAGLAVYFNHPSGTPPVEEKDVSESP